MSESILEFVSSHWLGHISIHKMCLQLMCVSSLVVSDSLRPPELYSPWNSLGQNTGMGSLSLLKHSESAQEIFFLEIY